jgi:diguanylate cyclase (GGDEF)-like protein
MSNAPWSSKITRRLFGVFLLLALVPTVVLTALTLGDVNQRAQLEAKQLLDEQAAAQVDSLLNRLAVLTEQLNDFVEAQAREVEPGAESEAQPGGVRFRVFPWSALEDAAGMRPGIDVAQRLRDDKPTLARIGRNADSSRVYLLRASKNGGIETKLVGAPVTENVVVGATDSSDVGITRCIFDERGRLLFHSDPELCREFTGLDAHEKNHPGTGSLQLRRRDYLADSRPVYLESRYGAHNWQAVVARPSALMHADAVSFQRRFLWLAALSIVSISLVGIYLIRRHMIPLEEIMAGIQRVASKDYDTPVRVNSGDEFEDMAEAFNTMSACVSHQLLTQKSMSDIDQLILSRVKKEDIIKIVLEKTPAVLPTDYIAMILLESGEQRGQVYRLSDSFAGELQSTNVNPGVMQLEELAMTGHVLIDGSIGELPAYILDSMIPPECNFELLPIMHDRAVIAMIILGHRTPPVLDVDHISLAHHYADRIAVALANAEWESRLFNQAHYDALTGLPNRMAFLDRLNQSVSRVSRQGGNMGIMFVDLDNFKLVNDTLGHPVGDRYIKAISERFKDCLRAEDTLSRLGGDEFVVTAVGGADHDLTVASISGVADRLLEAASEPVIIDGHELRGSVSIGIAIYPKDGEDSESLLRNADTAMYHAKGLGRGMFQFYSSELNTELLELMRLSTEIRTALEKDEFELFFQPKVDAFSHEVTGAEALIRWNHPERGLIAPGGFIGAAESLGLTAAIGEWTLEHVCRQLRAWRDEAVTPPRIAINVSAAQLRQTDLCAQVQAALQRHGLPGSDLELEITEKLLVQNTDAAVTLLERLGSFGVKISMDDYGSDHSSLAYIKELSVDTLKIDRGFINNLENDAADRAIVNSTIVLARHLGMKVLAEGVETKGQLQALQAFSCDEIQGYYFSQPLCERDFRKLLVEDRALEGSDSRTQAG